MCACRRGGGGERKCTCKLRLAKALDAAQVHGLKVSAYVHLGIYIGLARTIYIRCLYGTFGRKITKYTVIYGVYKRFWPTLYIYIYGTRYQSGSFSLIDVGSGFFFCSLLKYLMLLHDNVFVLYYNT